VILRLSRGISAYLRLRAGNPADPVMPGALSGRSIEVLDAPVDRVLCGRTRPPVDTSPPYSGEKPTEGKKQ
jgi:hypothetical protein